MIITVLAFIFLLGSIITVHEFGHFITAKIFNVYVHEFSIGMGPKLFSKKKTETEYALRLLPIGGYVSMAGENVNVEAELDKTVDETRKFYNQRYWKKLIILIAGVAMNFFLAILLFSGLLLSQGEYTSPVSTTISSITANSPAEKAGFKVGDKILAVETNNKFINVHTFTEIQLYTYDRDNEQITYLIERNGEQLELSVTPKYDELSERYLIGITAISDEVKQVNISNCLLYGIKFTIDQALLIINSFKLLFLPNGIKMLSGPIGIASITNSVTKQGLLSYLDFMGFVSLNIGIMNLLPLPILDGGQIVIETLEVIFKKKINEKLKIIMMMSCWALLVLVMLFATYNDILRIYS